MAKEHEDEFLQDVSLAEEEEYGEEEYTEEELELDALRAERDDLKDKWMRALADAENARKRGDRDRREAENYGGSKLARDLLPVYDNLKRGLEAATDDQREVSAALIEGLSSPCAKWSMFSKNMASNPFRQKLANVLTHKIMKPCLKRLFLAQKQGTSFR